MALGEIHEQKYFAKLIYGYVENSTLFLEIYLIKSLEIIALTLFTPRVNLLDHFS